MFARIAPRYDLLNRLLSAGIDRRWRRETVRRGGELEGRLVLDSCCGTGDLALEFRRAGARVIGADFAHEMVERAVAKRDRRAAGPGTLFLDADALRLPLSEDAVDLTSIAFGIRNLSDRGRGLLEFVRVTRPGGLVLVLEFSMPPSRLAGALYRLYFTRVLPTLGGWISGDAAAYRYLPDTVLSWPSPEQLQGEMEGAGLCECGFRRLSFGIACLSWGRVPDAGDR
jgi:demethylmenaquinone methyltransferase / 2-methoxy-6-polyprenyl-1,4-benzoquinol methylase